jgi:hypothetical protein
MRISGHRLFQAEESAKTQMMDVDEEIPGCQ